MCAVSVIYQYGQRMPMDWWTPQRYGDFQQLVKQAEVFDVNTEQADCEDPLKMEWSKGVEERLAELEAENLELRRKLGSPE